MDTLLLAADAEGAIGLAARRLAAGELVALPTETVYGLAADAARPEAVAAIFQAKERPFFDPLIVHLPGLDWLERLTQPGADERALAARLAAAFWPGPLTILLPRRPEAVPDLVTAGSALVAVRMSAHPVFAAVLREFGRPVAAPSANRFGRISPTTGEHVRRELDGRIPLILDAGPTAHGLESTVVLPEGADRLRILRPGPVTAEMLAAHARVVTTRPAGNASAPGQLPGHYAPRTPLRFYEKGSAVPGRVGLLAFREDGPRPSGEFARVETLSRAGDLREAAARLFAALRELDEAGLDGIVVQEVPETGLGVAIMERLRRAVAGSGGAGVFGSGHPPAAAEA